MTFTALRKPRVFDYVVLVVVAALWGSSFSAIRVAVAELPPLVVVTGRLWVAWALLRLLVARDTAGPRGARVAFVGVVTLALPYALVAWAETRVDASTSGLVFATSPLIALALLHALTRDEPMTKGRALAGVIGLVGTGLAVGAPAGDVDVPAVAALVAAAVCYALGGIAVRRAGGRSVDVFTARALGAGAIASLPFALVTAPAALPSADALLAVLYLGAVPTALGFLVRFRQVRALGYGFVSWAGCLVPLFAVAFGAALLGERPPASALAGGALVVAAIALARVAGPRVDR